MDEKEIAIALTSICCREAKISECTAIVRIYKDILNELQKIDDNYCM